MTNFWRSLAQRRPLPLVCDDLHWADDSSVELLQHLLPLTDEAAVLFLCALRPHREAPAWRLRLEAERRHPHRTREIVLKPLTAQQSRRLVDGLLQARVLPPELETRITDRAEGNPFFVEETIRDLIERGVLVRGEQAAEAAVDGSAATCWRLAAPAPEITIPHNLQALLTARIDRLGEGPRRTLQLASVIGRDFALQVLQMISPQPDAVPEHLSRLQNAGLIQEQTGLQHSDYSFRHGLMQDAAYASILLRQRRNYHAQVVRALEQPYVHTLDEQAATLAHHLAAAGDGPRAADSYERAADGAAAVFANAEALAYYTRAIELRDGLPIPDARRRRSLQRKRGRIAETLGRFGEARTDYESALAQARRDGDLEDESQTLLELGFLWSARDYEQVGQLFQEALQQARRLEEPSILAQSLNRVGNWYLNATQPQRAQQLHEEALAILQELADKSAMAETYDLLGLTLGNQGRLHQSMAYYERAAALFRELGNRRALASTLTTRTSVCAIYQLGELLPALHFYPHVHQDSEEALEITHAIGWRAGESYARFTAAILHASTGNYTRSLDEARAAIALAAQIGHRQWLCAGHWAMGSVLLELFSLDEARRHLQEALVLAQDIGSPLWTEFVVGILSRVLLLQDEPQQARHMLQLSYRPDIRPKTAAQRMIWRVVAQHHMAVGQPQQALNILQQLITFTVEDEGIDPPLQFCLQTLCGNALAALGQSAEAESTLLAAREIAETYFPPISQWRANTALARFYAAHKSRSLATKHGAFANRLLSETTKHVPPELQEPLLLQRRDF